MKNFILTHTLVMCCAMSFVIPLLPKQAELSAQDLTLCNQFGQPGPVYYEIGSAVGRPRASTLPSANFTPGQRVSVKGTFEVDVPTSFNGSIVKMDPGAWIFVSANGNLSIINGSNFFACNFMWRGISNLGGSAQVYDSYFEDAHVCFDLKSGTEWSFGGNDFNRNYVGIWVNGLPKDTYGIYGNRFRFSSALNLPYSGQPPMLGNGRPYCGVQITSTSTTIGRLNKNANTFDGLQCGIFAENARFLVYNSQFSNMLGPGVNFGGLIGGSGILAVRSIVEVGGNSSVRCVFHDNRIAGVRASASSALVYDADFFRNGTGIESTNTQIGHRFDVRRCHFTQMGAGNHLSGISRGILYERSFNSSTSVIANNTFHTAVGAQNFTATAIWAINVVGLTAANSFHTITRNRV